MRGLCHAFFVSDKNGNIVGWGLAPTDEKEKKNPGGGEPLSYMNYRGL